MKRHSLLHRLYISLACLLLPVAAHAAAFPYITLNKQTNQLSADSVALTYSGNLKVGNGNSYGFDWIYSNAYFDTKFTGVDSNGIEGLTVAITAAPSSVTEEFPSGNGIGAFFTVASTNATHWHALAAIESYVDNFGTNVVDNVFGGSSQFYNESTGTVGEAVGHRVAIYNYGSGAITNAYGYRVYAGLPGSERNYGLFIPNISGGSIENCSIKTGTGLVSFGDAVSTTSSYTSGAPSGGAAAAWKLGSYKTNAVTMISTNYIEVEIGGVLRKLAVVQ